MNMKIKKNLTLFAILIAIILIGVLILYISMNKYASTYLTFPYESLDLSKVEDGVYQGSEDGKIVKATVEVTVKDHKITNIVILSHDCGLGKPAESIVKDIIDKNSLEVDTVSGATHSSNVIRAAVFNALNQ